MTVFLVLQIIIIVALVAVILVQKTSSDGFTGASSSPNSFLTGRATANLFTRTTAILATAFIVNSLALAYMASKSEKSASVIDKAFKEKTLEEKAAEAKKNLKVKIEDLEDSAQKIKEEIKNKIEPVKKNIKKESSELKQKIEEKTEELKKQVPTSE
ncbi:MAG TPA: preprotein translocase subunit SecG [Alphaproteobacteria bacterium]|nr:preprotein translocase subunit SecG [Alphaproteobacteria bacterium]